MKRIIGVTGGVGAGKSSLLEILKSEYGAKIIQADQVAKELEMKGEPGYQALLERFGSEILNDDKDIDRVHLAKLIFSDADALAAVNEIIHPMTWSKIREEIRDSKEQLIVVEAALLDREMSCYDELWYVYTSEENRIQRLMKSRGYSRRKALDIMANQPTEEAFRRAADVVIDNNGVQEDLREQIRKRLEEEML